MGCLLYVSIGFTAWTHGNVGCTNLSSHQAFVQLLQVSFHLLGQLAGFHPCGLGGRRPCATSTPLDIIDVPPRYPWLLKFESLQVHTFVHIWWICGKRLPRVESPPSSPPRRPNDAPVRNLFAVTLPVDHLHLRSGDWNLRQLTIDIHETIGKSRCSLLQVFARAQPVFTESQKKKGTAFRRERGPHVFRWKCSTKSRQVLLYPPFIDVFPSKPPITGGFPLIHWLMIETSSENSHLPKIPTWICGIKVPRLRSPL